MRKNIFIMALLLLVMTFQDFAQTKGAKIIVGPNIQVSQDGNFTHYEDMAAINPTNSNNIIVTSSLGGTWINPFGQKAAGLYISFDGGKSWEAKYPMLDLAKNNLASGDSQVAFGKNGTAYFCAYGGELGKDGKIIHVLYFFKSTDGGKTWKRSNIDHFYGKLDGYDHPQLVIDHTNGNFKDRIYIGVLSISRIKDSPPRQKVNNADWQYFIRLFRSDDEGNSFKEPVVVITPEVGAGANVSNLMISSKGTLLFSYLEWCNDSLLVKNYFEDKKVSIVSSNDGGNTFSKKYIVAPRSLDYGQFAIDTHSGKYKDRIYCVYEDKGNKGNRIFLTYSQDEGKTWTMPKQVDNTILSGTDQEYPAVAVNSKGIIGIRWYNDIRLDKHDEYFTASLDGGESFLSPVRVSTQSSYASNKGDLIEPFWWRPANEDSLLLCFSNSSIRKGSDMAGDYYQFAADANGVFHDFWYDHRDGNEGQVYTSSIKVVDNDLTKYKEHNSAVKKAKQINKNTFVRSKNKKPIAITRYISLETDIVSYDTITNILSTSMKIKNISDKPIYGSITLEINDMDTTRGRKNIPVILNSDNKKSAVGATFTFALNNSTVLLPGALTKTVIWRFNVKIPHSVTKFTDEQLKEIFLRRKNWVDLRCESIPILHLSVVGYM